MSESEFDIIKNHFAALNADEHPDWLIKGIGDDAAVIKPADNNQLIIAMDTLNEGVHFPVNTSAADIGYKALAVNLSDIAAMGGKPVWFTLSLSLPESDTAWLNEFCSGMSELMKNYQLTLVGGDTTRGPLSVTVQICGEAPAGKIMMRSGARAGDDIYITGTPGEAAAALKLLKQNRTTNSNNEYLLQRLNRPTPRVALGLALREVAHACIDVSDGLVSDLGHILEQSMIADSVKIGADLIKQQLPVSDSLQAELPTEQEQLDMVLFGGDDYELCFTASPEQCDEIQKISLQHGIPITCIGTIIEENGLYLNDQGKRQKINKKGFEHFN